MNVPFHIAWRYLFAKKSHNVINIISAISAAGVAVGCAALIIIMSIFNGFNALVESHNRGYNPDLLVERPSGRVNQDEILSAVSDVEGIAGVFPVIRENVFARFSDNTSIVMVKGVDNDYPSVSGVDRFLTAGKFELTFGDIQQAIPGSGVAYDMQLRVGSMRPLELYFPNRDENISVVNPVASLKKSTLFVTGIFSLDYNLDKSQVFIPFQEARKLTGYEPGTASAVEIFFTDRTDPEKTMARVRERLGDDYLVKDQYMQNAAIYKVMKSEKMAIYLILFFIIFIISCNIFGSLLMLIIEKQEDVKILSAMGADRRLIRRIFLLEGWLISFSGVVAGILAGSVLSLIQQHFELLQMPGNYIVSAYPVVLEFSDILITAAGCGLIGLVIAALPLRFIRTEQW